MPRTGPGGSKATAPSPPRDLGLCHPPGTDVPVHRGWDTCDDSKASPERWRGGGTAGRTGAQGFALQLRPQPGDPAVGFPSTSRGVSIQAM